MVMDAWNNPAVSDEECLNILRAKRDRLIHDKESCNGRMGNDKAIECLNDMIVALEGLINVSGGKDE